VYEHREGLLILLYRSSGTSYEGAKAEFFDHLAEHMGVHITDYNHQNPTNPLSLQVSRPVAVAFLEGYFDIIRTHADRDQMTEITKQYMAVWFMGLKAVL
jgi:hypothetical protein